MLKGRCHCGQVSWSFEGKPESVTACNCTLCRRYGVLWAYDWEGEGIHTSGDTQFYIQGERMIEFHFCPTCGCVAYWRGAVPHEDGRRRIAVNVRLSEPEEIEDIPVDHFDGLETFEDLGQDGRTVKDHWF